MSQADDEQSVAGLDSRFSRAAFLTGVVAGVLALLLVYELLAFGNDWGPGIIGRLPEDLFVAAVVAWLALSVTSVILGVVQLARSSDVRWRPAAALGLGALSLLAVVVAVGAAMSEPAHASDEEMIAAFREQKAQFEELLQMYEADPGLGVIGTDVSGWPAQAARKGIASERIERYRVLLQDLDVLMLERRFGMVLFTMSTRGLAVSGSAKGYAYATTPPAPLVGDTERDADDPIGEVYRLIEGDWYLDYEWDT